MNKLIPYPHYTFRAIACAAGAFSRRANLTTSLNKLIWSLKPTWTSNICVKSVTQTLHQSLNLISSLVKSCWDQRSCIEAVKVIRHMTLLSYSPLKLTWTLSTVGESCLLQEIKLVVHKQPFWHVCSFFFFFIHSNKANELK